MSTLVDYPHIEQPVGESPHLSRLPRIRVAQIVIDYLNHGWSADEICLHNPHVRPAEVHSAMAYYFDHKAELDAEIADEQRQIAKSQAGAPPSAIETRLRSERRLPPR